MATRQTESRSEWERERVFLYLAIIFVHVQISHIHLLAHKKNLAEESYIYAETKSKEIPNENPLCIWNEFFCFVSFLFYELLIIINMRREWVLFIHSPIRTKLKLIERSSFFFLILWVTCIHHLTHILFSDREKKMIENWSKELQIKWNFFFFRFFYLSLYITSFIRVFAFRLKDLIFFYSKTKRFMEFEWNMYTNAPHFRIWTRTGFLSEYEREKKRKKKTTNSFFFIEKLWIKTFFYCTFDGLNI